MNGFTQTNEQAGQGLGPLPIHKIALEGHCSINGGDDVRCSTLTLSLSNLSILSSVEVSFADLAILSLPRLGLVRAVVSGTFPGGFDLKFEPAAHPKLAQYVQLLDERQRPDHEARDYQRFVPLKKLVTLRRNGEADSIARVIDVSRSGVAFTSSKAFTVGEELMIGSYHASIVRVLQGGATAHFDDVIGDASFDPMFDLDAPRQVDLSRSADASRLTLVTSTPRFTAPPEALG